MDPYRIYFPLGIVAALLGTLPWVTFSFGLSNFYPGLFHPDMMIGGFIFAFAAGFLMTAVPQFTGSFRCRSWELVSGATLFGILLATSAFQSRLWFHLASTLALLSLVFFCARRFLSRSYDPPRFFVFVGLGLLMGVVGAALWALADAGIVLGARWGSLARLIYTQGMVLALILGVGTHLLPAIWGWSDLPIQITRFGESESPLQVIAPVAGLALLLLASFLLEANGNAMSGWVLRAGLVTFLATTRWKLLKRPKARGKLAFWLWASAWALLVGLWAPVLFPAYWVHGIHIAFVGGFGLMTLMVASRVTLAHGGYGHRVELRSRLLTISSCLVLFSALTRAFAPVVPRIYLHHLGYAAGTWIVAILLWSVVFAGKMFYRSESSTRHIPSSE